MDESGEKIAKRLWRVSLILSAVLVALAATRGVLAADEPVFDATVVVAPLFLAAVVLGLADGVRRRSALSLRWARQLALGGSVLCVLLPVLHLTGAWRFRYEAWAWASFGLLLPFGLVCLWLVAQPALSDYVRGPK